MSTLAFRPQFAPAIRDGSKRTTIRRGWGSCPCVTLRKGMDVRPPTNHCPRCRGKRWVPIRSHFDVGDAVLAIVRTGGRYEKQPKVFCARHGFPLSVCYKQLGGCAIIKRELAMLGITDVEPFSLKLVDGKLQAWQGKEKIDVLGIARLDGFPDEESMAAFFKKFYSKSIDRWRMPFYRYTFNAQVFEEKTPRKGEHG